MTTSVKPQNSSLTSSHHLLTQTDWGNSGWGTGEDNQVPDIRLIRGVNDGYHCCEAQNSSAIKSHMWEGKLLWAVKNMVNHFQEGSLWKGPTVQWIIELLELLNVVAKSPVQTDYANEINDLIKYINDQRHFGSVPLLQLYWLSLASVVVDHHGSCSWLLRVTSHNFKVPLGRVWKKCCSVRIDIGRY